MLQFLHLPEETIDNQFIPKKHFYEHGNLNKKEKELFVKVIKRITLYAQLKTEDTNIPIYKDEQKTYEEVAILFVELRVDNHLEKLAKIIMELIPYPMILIFTYNEMVNFVGAHQRDNLQDSTKIILEAVYQTGFISQEDKFMNQIDYKKFDKQNFYTFYEDYIQLIISYNLKIRNVKEAEDNELLLEEIRRLEEEIKRLRNRLKREKQFNRKMDINMKIKILEAKLKKMGGIS